MKKTAIASLLCLFCAFSSAQVSLPSDIGRKISLPIERTIQRSRLAEVQSELTLPTPEIQIVIPDTINIKSTLGNTIAKETRDSQGRLAIAREWLLIGKQTDREQLDRQGFKIIEATRLTELDMMIYRLRAPKSMRTNAQIKRRLPKHLQANLTRNFVYLTQSATTQVSISASHTRVCDKPVKIGMVDTAIESSHPAFKAIAVKQKSFSLPDSNSNVAHGTAVAGILAAALPSGSEIVAASVFYERSEISQGATLMSLLKGLNWLTEQQLSVINLSLTGPSNPLLNVAIKQIVEKRITLIAAAGNDGPAALPAYPAAYPGVIAVTAVDQHDQIYRWANQGDYIDFSALGVSVITARQNSAWGSETGTSMAAPYVSAYSSCINSENGTGSLIESLKQSARDTGKPGKDPVFGWGVVH